MGTMALNCRKTWLAGWLLVLLTAPPAWSQGLEDAQFFAPAAMDEFGGGPRPNEGIFASIDYLKWTIQAPQKTEIGFQGGSREVWLDTTTKTIQTNTIDTGGFSADWTDGQRIEFGDVSEHHGWLFSGFRLHKQEQRDMYSSVNMVFQDLEYGDPAQRHLYGYVSKLLGYQSSTPYYEGWDASDLHNLPLSFDTVELHNSVETWGVEWNYLYRCHPIHNGGIFEFFLGARYLEFNETFDVDARGYRFEYDSYGTVRGARSILADSFWSMKADNHIVGPQIGARFFKTSGRWTLSTEGRFLAGTNFQNLNQRGTLGSKLHDPWGNDPNHNNAVRWVYPPGIIGDPWVPLAMDPASFNHSDHEREFAPAFEMRLEAKYQLTRVLAARFGWDVFWIDGIARSSDLIDYTLAENKVFGIKKENNRQSVLMQGFHVGIELNR
jgi:hypothetical protein